MLSGREQTPLVSDFGILARLPIEWQHQLQYTAVSTYSSNKFGYPGKAYTRRQQIRYHRESFIHACLVATEDVRQEMSLSVSHFWRQFGCLVEVQRMNEHLKGVCHRLVQTISYALAKKVSALFV